MTPHKVTWYEVYVVAVNGGRDVFYAGSVADLANQAQLMAVRAGFVPCMDQSLRYAEPVFNQWCRCKYDTNRQGLCPYGHIEACHWPQNCEQAQCQIPRPDMDPHEQMASWLATAVSPDDMVYGRELPAGHSGCRCSRCGQVIQTEVELVTFANVVTSLGHYVVRYHSSCLGVPTVADLS